MPLPEHPPLRTRHDDVILETAGARGSIWLDRPKALNALTSGMVLGIRACLDQLAADPAIESVTIGSTRPGVFCAGGDVRSLREAILARRDAEIDAFFQTEYALNRLIADYSKPFIALIDGICMGGGMGVSVHGRHRIVTENTVMAMPETAIGFFPDVGASYFLNRLPGQTGLYVGLTGARLSATDAIFCGLATAFMPQASLPDFSNTLASGTGADVEETIARFATPPLGISYLAENQEAIDRCFAADSVEDIMARLLDEETAFSAGALDLLRAASPYALRITLELLRENRSRDLATCLTREFELTRIARHHPDFAEGVRAALVDKDRAPHWAATL